MVQKNKDQFGRGLTKVRTNYAGPHSSSHVFLEAHLHPR